MKQKKLLKKVENIAYFYRIKGMKNRNTWIKSLMGTFFGYLIAANLNPILIGINTLVVAGIFMCIFALNNLFDYKLKNENNFTKKIIKQGVSFKRALIYCFIPLSVFPLILLTNTIAIILAAIFLLVGIVYSIPPLRLKQRKYGWISNTLCAGIVVLQAYFVLGATMNLTILMLLTIVLLFHAYTECFHLLVDHKLGEIKIDKEKVIKRLKSLQVIALTTSFLFAILNPIFIITAFFSLIRLNALRNIDSIDLCKIRFSTIKPLTSSLYASYELAIYGLYFFIIGGII